MWRGMVVLLWIFFGDGGVCVGMVWQRANGFIMGRNVSSK